MDRRAVYRLYMNPLLRVDAYVEGAGGGGRVRVKAKGPLSSLPAVRTSLEMIDGQVPAFVGDRLSISTWIPPIPSRSFDRLAKSRIKAALGIRTPDQVTISITEECPNRCAHCALPDSGRRLRLAPPAVKEIIGQVLDLGTTAVIFDGGEPTLYGELPELVSSVDDRAISTMFTSGAGFTPSLARDLRSAGLYAVNVSLDSPVAEEHDAMRGRRGAFGDAMLAIENALEAGLLVDVYAVLRRENVGQAEEFHRLAERVGAHELTFFEVVPTGRWSGRKGVALTGEDHTVLQRYVDLAPSPRIFSVPDALRRFGCFAGRSWIHVTPSGEVYPCSCLPRSCGNVLEEPMRSIWRRMGSLPYRGSKVCPVRDGLVELEG